MGKFEYLACTTNPLKGPEHFKLSQGLVVNNMAIFSFLCLYSKKKRIKRCNIKGIGSQLFILIHFDQETEQ